MDTVIIFLFWLFLKPLDIQMTRSRYLKVRLNLSKDKWNTFETIKDLPETFSSKEKPLLSSTMSGQNLKKSWFSKMGSQMDTVIIFLFWLFPKLLCIQITHSRYLKVCLDLSEEHWNTFETIRDEEKPLLSCTIWTKIIEICIMIQQETHLWKP